MAVQLTLHVDQAALSVCRYVKHSALWRSLAVKRAVVARPQEPATQTATVLPVDASNGSVQASLWSALSMCSSLEGGIVTERILSRFALARESIRSLSTGGLRAALGGTTIVYSDCNCNSGITDYTNCGCTVGCPTHGDPCMTLKCGL